MGEFAWKALGTLWNVIVDNSELDIDTRQKILDCTEDFEDRFSRFRPESEVNALRNAQGGTYTVSDEFSILLNRADRMRVLTQGAYDPAVALLLEEVGYNRGYTLQSSGNEQDFVLPIWSLEENALTVNGPVVFDLGGMGKGYWIDRVAQIIQDSGYNYFIVEGGGDMYGTSKADGSSWRVAIEYPGRPDTAASVVELNHQGVAVSDTFRKRWGKWNHLIDPHAKKSIERVIGAAAVSPSAWEADCMTSILFLSDPQYYEKAAREFQAQYLVINADGSVILSPQWAGEIFA